MRYRTLFILGLLFFSPSYSQNVDPCIQAQQDAKDAVWRPGWWAGGFLGNYFFPYGTIAVAFFYAPQPASVSYIDSLDQSKYQNCFEKAVKKNTTSTPDYRVHRVDDYLCHAELRKKHDMGNA